MPHPRRARPRHAALRHRDRGVRRRARRPRRRRRRPVAGLALEGALEQARPRDAFSLWHLLARVDGGDRARVFDRLAALVPPPDGVTRDGVLAGDRAMREAWWDELGLGSSDFWRTWTRHEPERAEAR
ncbi:MAG: hypothetical protein U0599_03010 [Vicinamibacteria bacterium]